MIGKDPRPSEEHMRQARHHCDVLLPALREVARSCGYAIAVHGSLERDIDLIAVPWRDMEMTPEYLVDKLFGVVSAIFHTAELRGPDIKPHGRRAWSMHFCGHHYVDLSVISPTPKAEPGQETAGK